VDFSPGMEGAASNALTVRAIERSLRFVRGHANFGPKSAQNSRDRDTLVEAELGSDFDLLFVIFFFCVSSGSHPARV
jgi:hypothetical protein